MADETIVCRRLAVCTNVVRFWFEWYKARPIFSISIKILRVSIECVKNLEAGFNLLRLQHSWKYAVHLQKRHPLCIPCYSETRHCRSRGFHNNFVYNLLPENRTKGRTKKDIIWFRFPTTREQTFAAARILLKYLSINKGPAEVGALCTRTSDLRPRSRGISLGKWNPNIFPSQDDI